jgi:hypothetical protein
LGALRRVGIEAPYEALETIIYYNNRLRYGSL